MKLVYTNDYVLGVITRVLQESETPKQAGKTLERWHTEVMSSQCVTELYNGMFDPVLEDILRGRL